MAASKKRRRFSSEQKIEILKRHLVNKENVSDICDEVQLHPNQFYRWQAELFSAGTIVFDKQKPAQRSNSERQRLESENAFLQKQLMHKDSVIAGITEDYVRLKKNSSALLSGSGLNPTHGMR